MLCSPPLKLRGGREGLKPIYHEFSVLHDYAHVPAFLLQQPYILERVAIYCQEVGISAGSDDTDPSAHVEKIGADRGGRADHLGR